MPNDYKYNNKEYIDDLSLNMLDYGARLYDPLTVRWNGVDALAEKYSSFSTYHYVLGNPVKYIDPDGLNTAYYNENGKLIHYSYDDLDNAVTIIPQNSLQIFMQTTGGHLEASYRADAAQELRYLGVSYLVGGIIDFHHRALKYRDNTGDFYAKSSNGKFVPANTEYGNYLYVEKNGRSVHIGKTDEDVKGNQVGPTTTIHSKTIGGTRVGKVHYHPDTKITLNTYVKGNFSKPMYKPEDLLDPTHDMPSTGDSERHEAVHGYYNIVTSTSSTKKGDHNIHFYTKGKPIITVPVSIFKKQHTC